MTTVADILKFMEAIAPRTMMMDWDNVGLLCGRRNAEVTKLLVALDPFEHVCKEAADWGAELIVTHHPIIFQATKAVTDDTSIGRSILQLCRHGIAAINPTPIWIRLLAGSTMCWPGPWDYRISR